jgi:hypothetical protein
MKYPVRSFQTITDLSSRCLVTLLRQQDGLQQLCIRHYPVPTATPNGQSANDTSFTRYIGASFSSNVVQLSIYQPYFDCY